MTCYFIPPNRLEAQSQDKNIMWHKLFLSCCICHCTMTARHDAAENGRSCCFKSACASEIERYHVRVPAKTRVAKLFVTKVSRKASQIIL